LAKKKTTKKETPKKDKKKPSELVLDSLNKAFGKESVIKMIDARPLEVIPTGLMAIDWGVLGIGGFPKGYFIEIYGKEKVGETSLILHTIASCHKKNIVPIILDPKLSAADDIERAKRIGVDLDEVVMIPLSTSEKALDMVKNTINIAKENGFDVMIFWDDMSLATTEKSTVANKSRIMWEFCRELGGVCYRTGTSVILANHLISKIGNMFGALYTTTGGGGSRALSRVRLLLKNKGKWEKSGKSIGKIISIKTDANAFFSPEQEADLYLNFKNGYDNPVSVLENAVKERVVTKASGSYSYGDLKGRANKFDDKILMELCKETWPESFGLEKKKRKPQEKVDLEGLYIDE